MRFSSGSPRKVIPLVDVGDGIYSYEGNIVRLDSVLYKLYRHHVCSGSVMVTDYDFESGRPGSNPEWGSIYYTASINA